jgi:hypothetical protein
VSRFSFLINHTTLTTQDPKKDEVTDMRSLLIYCKSRMAIRYDGILAKCHSIYNTMGKTDSLQNVQRIQVDAEIMSFPMKKIDYKIDKINILSFFPLGK